jgi:hypothetical protein
MRRMWLWVLLYALGIGITLFSIGFIFFIIYVVSSAGGTAYDNGVNAGIGSIFVTIVGFLALIAGMVFLLIQRTVAAGRVVTLIGLGFYYVAALGVVLAMAMAGGNFWEDIGFGLAIIIVPVGLPGFFITRTLLRAIKAERSEN